jgi:exodeoxyribonuclease VII small subunit
MAEKTLDEMSYEEKERRLDEILSRLDRSQTPLDALAAEAKEAGALIRSMRETLKGAQLRVEEALGNDEDTRRAAES